VHLKKIKKKDTLLSLREKGVRQKVEKHNASKAERGGKVFAPRKKGGLKVFRKEENSKTDSRVRT